MIMTTAPLVLNTALGTAPYTRALKDASITSDRVSLQFAGMARINDAFPRMVRELAYDVCHMSPTTYLVAKSFGKRITALPVFLNRHFHHGVISCHKDSGIETGKDLEGKSAGVGSWTITTGVWGRVVVQTEYDVDLEAIKYFSFEDPHVAEYSEPAWVTRAPEGKKLNDMLNSGELDAGFAAGLPNTAEVQPLIKNIHEVEEAWYHRTGIYPIVHIVVVRDDLLEEHQWLAVELFRMFEAAKDTYLGELRSGGGTTDFDKLIQWQGSVVGGDPLPYGLEPNKVSIQALVDTCHQQSIIPSKPEPEELFAAV
jgi:4,5-dihydroxyphthalate decarboxylase